MPEKIVTVHMAAAAEMEFLRNRCKTDDVKVDLEDGNQGIKLGESKPGPARATPGQGRESVDSMDSNDESDKDKSANVDIVEEAVPGDSPVSTGILVCAIAHIILGVSGVGINVALMYTEKHGKFYLGVSGASTEGPLLATFASGCFSILCGGATYICLISGYRYFFRYCYINGMVVSVVLDMLVIGYSVQGWKPINLSIYQNVFESKAFGLCPERDPIKYRFAYKPELQPEFWTWLHPDEERFAVFKLNFWSKLETDMKCCGMDGPSDYLELCGKIPDNCCEPGFEFEECKSNLSLWNVKDMAEKKVSDVEHFLYDMSCGQSLTRERYNLERANILYPALIFFFKIILMATATRFGEEFRLKLKLPSGHKEFRLFRERFCRTFCCKCCYICCCTCCRCCRVCCVCCHTKIRPGDIPVVVTEYRRPKFVPLHIEHHSRVKYDKADLIDTLNTDMGNTYSYLTDEEQPPYSPRSTYDYLITDFYLK